ncbi:helix-hairpin-helix domain-containing protein [Bifidobacterium sp. 82T24]|nr:helix-hairpin-helix domain-containing protein [Bifidobacterium pluvialisilvae]
MTDPETPSLPKRRGTGGRRARDGSTASPGAPLMLSMLSGVSPDDHGAEELLDRHTSRNVARLTLDGRHAAVIILVLVFVLSISLTLLAQQARHVDSMTADTLPEASASSSARSVSPSGSTTSSGSTPSSSSASSQSPTPQTPSQTAPPAQTSSSSASTSSAAPAPSSGLIDLNAATAEQLETINGVGPVTARRILDHRAQNGRFSSVDDLLDVPGIGAKTLEKIRPYVTVGT